MTGFESDGQGKPDAARGVSAALARGVSDGLVVGCQDPLCRKYLLGASFADNGTWLYICTLLSTVWGSLAITSSS
jgi:hypothetical protein